MKTAVGICCLVLSGSAPGARAERLLQLSFDRMERTPTRVELLPDHATSPVNIVMSDSAKLVKGVGGLGVYVDDPGDFLYFDGGDNIRAEEGAMVLWLRPMWGPGDGRDKGFFLASFERGHILLWSNTLSTMVSDSGGSQSYAPAEACADTSRWIPGEWHHVALNWSVQADRRQLFVDGRPRAPSTYPAPAGRAGRVYLSRPPGDTSGRYPPCSVIDELAIYDKPLSPEEISVLHEKGRRALGDAAPGAVLQVSVFPNLAAAAKLVMSPKPDYGPPVYSSVCNDPNDGKQLSDGDWSVARYNDLRSVGWVSGRIALEYDLGALRRIGAVAVNMGAGGAGTCFPQSVCAKAGASPDRLTVLGRVSTAESYPNPEHPKWRARTVGLDSLDCTARFVTVEIEGAAFLDEVFIIEKDAEPVFRRLVMELPGKPAEVARAEAGATEAAAPQGTWGITLRNRITRLRPPERLSVEVGHQGTGAPHSIVASYTSKMLLRGDTVYARRPGGGWKTTAVDTEMKTVLEGKSVVELRPKENGGHGGTLELPLKSHPYGLFYLTVAAEDEKGNSLGKATFRYEVLPEVQAEKGESIAGLDGHGWIYAWHGFESPNNKPGESGDRSLLDYGHSWSHPRTNWAKIHRKPGDMERRRFEILDLWVDSALKQNARVVMCLADAVPAAIMADGSLFEPMFREWAEALIGRYGNKVAVWDVWNEPDSKPYAQEDDRDIVAIKIAHELKMQYGPESAVVVSAHTSLGLNYVRRILEKGAGPYLDGIGLHPYRGLAPEIPEADGYAGNPTGMRTLLSSLAHARELLLGHGVEPADIYLTEANYALNLVPQYDDNDQANFMVRMNILAWTTGYTKCLLHHAFGNGRLAPSTYPNMVRHIADTTFWKKLDSGDEEIHAYAFRKPDGRVIVPLWSIQEDKLVRLTGLADRPVVTDIWGNELDIVYDAARKTLEFLRISQAPAYVRAPDGSDPAVSVSRRLELDVADSIERGGILALNVQVRSMPAEGGTLTAQFAPGWNPPAITYEVTGPGRFPFHAQAPASVEPGTYPVVVCLAADDGRALGIESREVEVLLPRLEQERRHGVVVSSDFEADDLPGWQVQSSPQYQIRVAEEEGRRFLRMTQMGIDYAAVIDRVVPAVKYGALEFHLKAPAARQSFAVHLGELTLKLDREQSIGLHHEAGEFRRAGECRRDQWHRVSVFFASPEGWCRLWLDGRFLGRFAAPVAPDGYARLRFMCGSESTAKPAAFSIDNVRLTRIDPTPLDGETPLRWTICGPFPNRIDPETMKRPFEIGKDYLISGGGESPFVPHPGLAVSFDKAERRTFIPFHEAERTPTGDLIDFFMVRDLGFVPEQGDILCYAGCFLLSPDERAATLGVGSDDGYVLWLNHERIGEFNAWPTGRGTGGPQEQYEVMLREGLNLIFLKVDQGSGAYRFYVDLKH